MADVNPVQNPTDRYHARIMVAALTKCRDHDEAAKLMAQYFALAPHIERVFDQAEQLADNKEFRREIALLDEMIGKVEQFTSPYPAEAVRDVFGYDIARLYFFRALARFGGLANTADPIPVLNTTLTDLDRAQSYPRACFAELNLELPDRMSEFRTVVEACIKGQKEFEAKQSGNTSVTKSSGCMTLIAACGLVGLLGVVLM